MKPVDSLLGRDYIFNRMASPGVVRSRLTLVAYDPVKGYRFQSQMAPYPATWLTDDMFQDLLAAGVLEDA